MRLKLQREWKREQATLRSTSIHPDSRRISTSLKNRLWLVIFALTACTLSVAAQGKDSFTPMPLDAGFGHMDISAPSTPPDQIIKQFAAKESEFQDALNHYTYRRYAQIGRASRRE